MRVPSGIAVGVLVLDLDGALFALDLEDAQHRAEDLVVQRLVRRIRVQNDCRTDPNEQCKLGVGQRMIVEDSRKAQRTTSPSCAPSPTADRRPESSRRLSLQTASRTVNAPSKSSLSRAPASSM